MPPPRSTQLELWDSASFTAHGQDMLFSIEQLDALSAPRPKAAPRGSQARSNGVLDDSFAQRRPLNILVADDNEINRKVIRVILQKLGYSCVEAANGEEALDHYNKGGYDYVFMDLDMPEMDGISATQAIRELEDSEAEQTARKAEIIAVTANVSDETRLLCRRAGMNGYLEKPVTAAMIKNQLLRSWSRIRARRDGQLSVSS